jgi:acyl-CoA thioester hydrolase
MFHSSNYRVSYGDTDQMAVVYYGNYLEFFERSRTEMLRDCGLPYTELERRGWLLMVIESHCRHFAPAHYDDLLTFKSAVAEITRVRIKIVTRVYRDDTLLAEGYVVLGSVDKNYRISRLDPEFVQICRKYTLEEQE